MSILAQFWSWVTAVDTQKNAQIYLGNINQKFSIVKKRHLPKNWLPNFKIGKIGKDTAILAQFWSWVTTVDTRKNAQIDLGNNKWKFPILKKRHLPKNWLPSFKIERLYLVRVIKGHYGVTTVAPRNNWGGNQLSDPKWPFGYQTYPPQKWDQ